MTDFDVIAFAASAGGLAALIEVLSHLPKHFPAAIVIVQHLDPSHRSFMANILSRQTLLPVKEAEHNDQLGPGKILIAPPNQHLLVNSDASITLSQSELVRFLRPSADLLFKSVASSYRERALCVVLTGTGSDGAKGATAVKEHGGTVIAQDRSTSEFFGMPGAAIQTGFVDFILPLDKIAPMLVKLVMKEDPK